MKFLNKILSFGGLIPGLKTVSGVLNGVFALLIYLVPQFSIPISVVATLLGITVVPMGEGHPLWKVVMLLPVLLSSVAFLFPELAPLILRVAAFLGITLTPVGVMHKIVKRRLDQELGIG